MFWWSKYQTKQLEKLKCVVASDVESFLQIQKILNENNIFFSQRNYSNYQESFNQPGLLTKAPKEIWINESSFEQVQRILKQ